MARTIAASSDGSGTPSADLWRVFVRCPVEAADAVAEILGELGAPGCAIVGEQEPPPGDDSAWTAPPTAPPGEVSAWLPAAAAREAAQRLAAMLRDRVEPYFGPVACGAAPAPAVDWVAAYRSSVRAMRVAPGLWVEPPWDPARPAAGEQVLRIEPGAAFGWGDHPSTRTCLRLLVRWLREGQDVLDMGSGSGILGAAALLLGAGRLRACDTDPLAVEATRDTLRRNGLKGSVRLGTLGPRSAPADLLLANISGRGLRPWLPRLRAAVRPDGIAILGGVLASDRAFDEAVAAAGLHVVDESREGEWRALAATRS